MLKEETEVERRKEEKVSEERDQTEKSREHVAAAFGLTK